MSPFYRNNQKETIHNHKKLILTLKTLELVELLESIRVGVARLARISFVLQIRLHEVAFRRSWCLSFALNETLLLNFQRLVRHFVFKHNQRTVNILLTRKVDHLL